MGGRGASSSLLGGLNKKLLTIEQGKRSLDKEMLTIMSRDGKILKQILGQETSVKVKYPELTRDNITTHNHPSNDVSYFSSADLETFIHNRVYETRVSTDKEVYSLKRAEERVNNRFPIKYRIAVSNAVKKARSETTDNAEVHALTSEYVHKWMKRNAKKNGFTYKRIRYK